jgi:hypothetical protein
MRHLAAFEAIAAGDGCYFELDSARRISAQLAEKLSVASDGSKISRSGGQKQLKSFRNFHFRRKSAWVKELKIQKRF